jgi:hypothetical protein
VVNNVRDSPLQVMTRRFPLRGNSRSPLTIFVYRFFFHRGDDARVGVGACRNRQVDGSDSTANGSCSVGFLEWAAMVSQLRRLRNDPAGVSGVSDYDLQDGIIILTVMVYHFF